MKTIKSIGLSILILFIMTTISEGQKKLQTKAAVREAMVYLIDRATNFDIKALETIYHKDFHTTLVMHNGKVVTYNKKQFIKHFANQAKEAKKQLNTWAEWHDFNIIGNSAVCVLTRQHSGMNGHEMRLLCNIELRLEDGRWQVIREAIFLLPINN
jgi:flavin-dependent dehydrogenase